MTSQEDRPKILRIGILQRGRIVAERLIDPGTPVTVGTSAHNTFVFPETGLPTTEFVLFAATKGGYALRVTRDMRGRLSAGGNKARVADLHDGHDATVVDDIARLPLTPSDRGKLQIGDVTVLFQFVVAPPKRVATPLARMDFRPRMLDEDDPVFLGFLATWSALATLLLVWVWGTEPATFTLDDVPEAIVRLHVPPPVDVEDPEIEPLETDVGEEVVRDIEDDAVADADVADPDDGGVAEEVRRAREHEERKDDLIHSNPLLIALIGTNGEAKDQVQQVWGGDDGMDLDGLLAEAEGGTTDPEGLKYRGCDGTCDHVGGAADIADLSGIGGGGEGGEGTGEAMRVTHEVTVPQDGTFQGTADSDTSVGDVVASYAGQLQYCYEDRLKVLPDLGGRVEIAWTVEGGETVGSPMVILNTTGDGELAECVGRKIRRWRFPADVEGEASYPFVFRPKD